MLEKSSRYLQGFSYLEVMVALLIFSAISVTVMRSCVHGLRLANDNRYRLIATQLLANYQAWVNFSGESLPSSTWESELILLPEASYHLLEDKTSSASLQLCWQTHEKHCLNLSSRF